MSTVEREIREQPAVLRRALPGLRRAISRLDGWPRRVVLVGVGSSGWACRWAAARLEANGVPASAPSAETLAATTSRPDLRGDWVVAVSQSGETPGPIGALRRAGRRGAIPIAVTNDPSSTLAGVAGHVLLLRAGVERAVPATKTFTASLLALSALVEHLVGNQELDGVPGEVAEALAHPLGDVDRLADAPAAAVAAPEPLAALAPEIALKMMEIAGIPTWGGSLTEYLHGPCAALSTHPVILLGRSRRGVRRALTLDGLVSARETGAAFRAVVLGQRLAVAVARLRGRDPDRPPGLRKVTRV